MSDQPQPGDRPPADPTTDAPGATAAPTGPAVATEPAGPVTVDDTAGHPAAAAGPTTDRPGPGPGGGAATSAPVDDHEEATGPTRLRLRRAPRYRAFGFTGVGFGVLAGLVLALSFTAASDYSTRTVVGYFAAVLGLLGGVAGLGVAVVLERRRRRAAG